MKKIEATWHFMQWFIKEQTEEETLALNLLDKIKISGGATASGDALYNIDKINKLNLMMSL